MQTLSTLAPPQRTGRAIVAHLSKLYLSHRTGIQRAVWLSLLAVQITQVRNAVAEQKDAARRAAEGRAKGAAAASRGKSSNKIKLDRHFARSMLRLLRIVIPGWRSPEARLLVSHSFFLVARTVLSLWVADMDGAIVKSLVKRNGKEFMKRIVWWMVLAVPATFTNAMVRRGKSSRRGEDGWLPLLFVSRIGLLTVCLFSFLALISPSRPVAQVPDASDPAPPREVPLTAGLLQDGGA